METQRDILDILDSTLRPLHGPPWKGRFTRKGRDPRFCLRAAWIDVALQVTCRWAG